MVFAEEHSQGWERLTDMPGARSEMESAVIDENIYVIGGGVIPGFSYSVITEKYHNTIVPEFGILASIVFVTSIAMVILFTKSKLLSSLNRL